MKLKKTALAAHGLFKFVSTRYSFLLKVFCSDLCNICKSLDTANKPNLIFFLKFCILTSSMRLAITRILPNSPAYCWFLAKLLARPSTKYRWKTLTLLLRVLLIHPTTWNCWVGEFALPVFSLSSFITYLHTLPVGKVPNQYALFWRFSYGLKASFFLPLFRVFRFLDLKPLDVRWIRFCTLCRFLVLWVVGCCTPKCH